jgi:tetratricopeptide (TPR) repeat protein
MRSEGWTDYKVIKQDELDRAESMRRIEDYRQAIAHLERALFLDPSDLTLELRIEVLEEKAEMHEKRQNAQRKIQNEIGL